MTLLQSINHILESGDGYTSHLAQLVHVCRELWLFDVHSLVRTPCGNHLDFESTLTCLLVITQVINGIVSGTYTLYMIMTHQTACRELWLLQLLVTLVKNLACCLGAQLFGNAEGSLQLQMSPMIQGVTEGIWHCFCPFLKLLPVCCIFTRAVFFIHTIGTHGTPLIVVTTQPQLGNALEAMVIGNHFGNQVAVIVDNGHFSCMVMEKILSYLSVEQEMLVIKLFHNIYYK